MNVLSKIWNYLTFLGESIAEARMKQAEYFRKHKGWE
jgi:hypothetical protein